MANPNPETEHLKATQYEPLTPGAPLQKVRGTRYPADVDAVLEEMGPQFRSWFIRDAVRKAMIRDGLLKER